MLKIEDHLYARFLCRFLDFASLDSHWMQWCSFSPVCFLSCIFKLLECAVLYSHWLQLYIFFLTMLFHMLFEGWSNTAWIVAMCALVRFLAAVNKGVGLQINLLTKWLAALYEALRFFPRMYAGAGLQTSILTELWAGEISSEWHRDQWGVSN